MRTQASILKEIAKRIKSDELRFTITEYPDNKFYNVTHRLLDNPTENKKFKYNTKNQAVVQASILKYFNELGMRYNLPPPFLSWDTLPPDVLKQKIEAQLERDNISPQTFIGFYCIDEPEQSRVKLSYSVNNQKKRAQAVQIQ
jgi:hypothetical protein